MVKEGLEIVREISKRYDGRHRGKGEVSMASNATVDGTGSPFGEDECGKFYARAMSSWSVLLALQGFIYDGPRGIIGFKPGWKPEAHRSFFSAASGWGLFTRQRNEQGRQTDRIALRYGTLTVRELIFDWSGDALPASVTVETGDRPLESTWTLAERELRITLDASITLKAGETLTVLSGNALF